MNDKAPVRPDQPTGSPMGADRSFPPNPEDPSRAIVGFPSGAVERLRAALAANEVAIERADLEDGSRVIVSRQAVDEVLAWIDRYVPRPLETCERFDAATFTVEVDDPIADRVELIRFNGRTFVEETPTIASEGPFTAGPCSVKSEAALDGAAVFSADGEPYCLIDSDTVVGGDPMPRATLIANLLNEEAKGLDLGAACDEIVATASPFPTGGEFHGFPIAEAGRCRVCGCTQTTACDVPTAVPGETRACAWTDATMTLCDAPGCVDRAPGLGSTEPFERRPPVEGLECVKTLGPAYARDAGGRPVHIGEAEPTDAEGRFPGDLGYVRPE